MMNSKETMKQSAQRQTKMKDKRDERWTDYLQAAGISCVTLYDM